MAYEDITFILCDEQGRVYYRRGPKPKYPLPPTPDIAPEVQEAVNAHFLAKGLKWNKIKRRWE